MSVFVFIFALVSFALSETTGSNPPCPLRSCPSSQTCCGLVSVGYGCCPKYSNATCCADNIHCCPSDYTCDIEAKSCKPIAAKGKRAVDMPFVMVEAQVEEKKTQVTACASGTCGSGETCCVVGSGKFGCCPFPNADCCSDNSHCCPQGYSCDVNKGECVKSATALRTKIPLRIPFKNIITKPNKLKDACPASTCPSTETCCDIGNGQYGCCPYPNAICCSDHSHCCPQNYQCDVNKHQCVHSVTSDGLGLRGVIKFSNLIKKNI